MSGQLFKTLQRSSLLDGGNVAYLESLYETWLQDPDAVAPHWRDYFGALPAVNGQVRSDLSREEAMIPSCLVCRVEFVSRSLSVGTRSFAGSYARSGCGTC